MLNIVCQCGRIHFNVRIFPLYCRCGKKLGEDAPRTQSQKQYSWSDSIFPELRLGICLRCPANHDNICQEYKKLHPEKPCLISIGVKIQNAHCPIDKW